VSRQSRFVCIDCDYKTDSEVEADTHEAETGHDFDEYDLGPEDVQ
jgi:hypothetical protein